jgi:hypothetical protein
MNEPEKDGMVFLSLPTAIQYRNWLLSHRPIILNIDDGLFRCILSDPI